MIKNRKKITGALCIHSEKTKKKKIKIKHTSLNLKKKKIILRLKTTTPVAQCPKLLENRNKALNARDSKFGPSFRKPKTPCGQDENKIYYTFFFLQNFFFY